MDKDETDDGLEATISSDPALNRKQFLALVLKRAGIAGAIVVAPKVVDSFLVPPVYAGMYTPNPGEDTTQNKNDTG